MMILAPKIQATFLILIVLVFTADGSPITLSKNSSCPTPPAMKGRNLLILWGIHSQKLIIAMCMVESRADLF